MSEYQNLIIKQYFDKPKAMADIAMREKSHKNIADTLKDIEYYFDIDNAMTDQLDIIGRIVVLPRQVNAVIPRTFFGFDGNQYAKGFADRFDNTRDGAPFYDRFEPPFLPQTLNNEQYRRFLKAKVLTNNAIGTLAKRDDKISVQEAIQVIFNGRAYVVDNQDMTATLFVNQTVNEDELRLIMNLNLIPKVLGVEYIVERF